MYFLPTDPLFKLEKYLSYMSELYISEKVSFLQHKPLALVFNHASLALSNAVSFIQSSECRVPF